MNVNDNINGISRLSMLGEDDRCTEKEFLQILSFLTPRQGEIETKTLLPSAVDAKLRQDLPQKGLDKDTLLALAPKTRDGFIVVPWTLEET